MVDEENVEELTLEEKQEALMRWGELFAHLLNTSSRFRMFFETNFELRLNDETHELTVLEVPANVVEERLNQKLEDQGIKKSGLIIPS